MKVKELVKVIDTLDYEEIRILNVDGTKTLLLLRNEKSKYATRRDELIKWGNYKVDFVECHNGDLIPELNIYLKNENLPRRV